MVPFVVIPWTPVNSDQHDLDHFLTLMFLVLEVKDISMLKEYLEGCHTPLMCAWGVTSLLYKVLWHPPSIDKNQMWNHYTCKNPLSIKYDTPPTLGMGCDTPSTAHMGSDTPFYCTHGLWHPFYCTHGLWHPFYYISGLWHPFYCTYGVWHPFYIQNTTYTPPPFTVLYLPPFLACNL